MITEATAPDNAAVEQAIRECVEKFYVKAVRDPLLAPVFKGRIPNWNEHMTLIQSFWSKALLGTDRYNGHAFPVHMRMPVEPEHFDRWLELFEEAARETLRPEHADAAMAKARHMSYCMQTGIFPFKDKQGRPARLPG